MLTLPLYLKYYESLIGLNHDELPGLHVGITYCKNDEVPPQLELDNGCVAITYGYDNQFGEKAPINEAREHYPASPYGMGTKLDNTSMAIVVEKLKELSSSGIGFDKEEFREFVGSLKNANGEPVLKTENGQPEYKNEIG